MSTKEQIVQELQGMSQAELEQVAHYLAFIRFQSRVGIMPSFDENELAALYGESTEEDRELAEVGISDYAEALAQEDAG